MWQKAEAEMDVGLVLKLQNKVKDLEREKKQLTEKLESMEEDSSRGSIISETAFDALRVSICKNENVVETEFKKKLF